MCHIRICSQLHNIIQSAAVSGEVIAVFRRAIYIRTPIGLVSILPPHSSLLPFSIEMGENEFKQFSKEGEGIDFRVTRDDLNVGHTTIMLKKASCKDLSLLKLIKERNSQPVSAKIKYIITEIIKKNEKENGISSLVTEEAKNHYSEFIRQKLPTLVRAVKKNNSEEAGEAAAALAGCGIGLTPSADDFMCGYMTALHFILYTKEKTINAVISSIAQSAASRTNYISANFLLQCGHGLVSESVLELAEAVFFNQKVEAIMGAAEKVADIGSTSGSDILTGFITALRYHEPIEMDS